MLSFRDYEIDMKTKMHAVLLLCMLVLSAGCNSDPPIYPITGKVSLGGETHARLIVYMRPVNGAVNQFNMGVGETDANGVMKFGSAAGEGLAAGKYRVSFSCIKTTSGEILDALTDKGEENVESEPIEMVPPPYDYKTNADTSPLEFEVRKQENGNVFEFDIPLGN